MRFRRHFTVFLGLLLFATATFGVPERADAQLDDSTLSSLVSANLAASVRSAAATPPAIADVIAAVESYGAAHGTYTIAGAGNRDRGIGWFEYVDGGTYKKAIASALIDGGHLTASSSAVTGTANKKTMLVYTCKDRFGVFTKIPGGTGSAADTAWWTSNRCANYPLSRGFNSFRLGEPLDPRSTQLAEVVSAFEAYSETNGTYTATGGGHRGAGIGWLERGNSGRYESAISDLLIEGGHLASNAPLLAATNSLVYLCKDRVGVFTNFAGLSSAPVNQQWWNANSCTKSPLNSGHSFFQLSRPLQRPTCLGKPVTVMMELGEQPTGGTDVIFGTPGDDALVAYNRETVCGGNGNDTIDIRQGTDTRVDGGLGDDTFTGTSLGNTTIYGGGGNDTVLMEANSNSIVVHGGDGDDTINGTSERDTLNGDGGNDRIEAGDHRDTVNGGSGNDFLSGGAGQDVINGGDGNDTIDGGEGSDRLNGDRGNDRINGSDGPDIINGGDGNDDLRGQDGIDVIDGGAGDDIINGGRWWDTVTGGSGTDTCHDRNDNCELKGDVNAPTDFAFQVASGDGYVITVWEPSTDDVGVVAYEIWIDGFLRKSVESGSKEWNERHYAVPVTKGLHAVQVMAVDDQGNTSRDVIVHQRPGLRVPIKHAGEPNPVDVPGAEVPVRDVPQWLDADPFLDLEAIGMHEFEVSWGPVAEAELFDIVISNGAGEYDYRVVTGGSYGSIVIDRFQGTQLDPHAPYHVEVVATNSLGSSEPLVIYPIHLMRVEASETVQLISEAEAGKSPTSQRRRFDLVDSEGCVEVKTLLRMWNDSFNAAVRYTAYSDVCIQDGEITRYIPRHTCSAGSKVLSETKEQPIEREYENQVITDFICAISGSGTLTSKIGLGSAYGVFTGSGELTVRRDLSPKMEGTIIHDIKGVPGGICWHSRALFQNVEVSMLSLGKPEDFLKDCSSKPTPSG